MKTDFYTFLAKKLGIHREEVKELLLGSSCTTYGGKKGNNYLELEKIKGEYNNNFKSLEDFMNIRNDSN